MKAHNIGDYYQQKLRSTFVKCSKTVSYKVILALKLSHLGVQLWLGPKDGILIFVDIDHQGY